MSNRKILFIVEGPNDETRFVHRLLQVCYSKQEYKTYSYKTNIHVLAKHLEEDYPDFENEDIDIQLILRQYETDENQRQLLAEHYTDIFLIFDFEPRERSPHFEMISRMVSYFDDSTNKGKLFINYPMMQSYKHFPHLPYPEFENEKVSSRYCERYKENVAKMSGYTDLGKYDYPLFMSLAVHHLRKANHILIQNYDIPSVEEYLSWDMSQIFDKQVHFLNDDGSISVLNTCIFILCDYRPRSFFKQLCSRNASFMI